MSKHTRSMAGKAQKMKDLLNDPKTAKHVRGWIKQELNRGKPFSKIGLPPQYELAHFRGFESSKGFNYLFTSLQLKDNHNTQHKYDNHGLLNKTPKNINIKIEKSLALVGKEIEWKVIVILSIFLVFFDHNSVYKLLMSKIPI